MSGNKSSGLLGWLFIAVLAGAVLVVGGPWVVEFVTVLSK